jgi:hypothetical protein
MDKDKDFMEWMDAHVCELEDLMHQSIDDRDPSKVYGGGERLVMSLTFTDGDPLGIGETADKMLTHYRCVVASRMGETANKLQAKGGYPLEYAMTSNEVLLGAYYNLCARYARARGEDCIVSVARY